MFGQTSPIQKNHLSGVVVPFSGFLTNAQTEYRSPAPDSQPTFVHYTGNMHYELVVAFYEAEGAEIRLF